MLGLRMAFARLSLSALAACRDPGSARPEESRCPCTCQRSGDRLRTDEEGRHHHLISQHKIVDDSVVPIKLEPPWLGCGRLAYHSDEVEPFAEKLVVIGQFCKGLVEPH